MTMSTGKSNLPIPSWRSEGKVRDSDRGRNRDRENEIVTHMQTWESEEGRRRRRETVRQTGRRSCGGERQRHTDRERRTVV